MSDDPLPQAFSRQSDIALMVPGGVASRSLSGVWCILQTALESPDAMTHARTPKMNVLLRDPHAAEVRLVGGLVPLGEDDLAVPSARRGEQQDWDAVPDVLLFLDHPVDRWQAIRFTFTDHRVHPKLGETLRCAVVRVRLRVRELTF